MSTVRLEAQILNEQLLRAVKQIPEQDLDSFIAHVLAVRAQRAAPHLNADETALLAQINATLQPTAQQRFDILVAKRRAETLASAERQEFINPTSQVEQHNAQRVAALAQLAQLWQNALAATYAITWYSAASLCLMQR